MTWNSSRCKKLSSRKWSLYWVIQRTLWSKLCWRMASHVCVCSLANRKASYIIIMWRFVCKPKMHFDRWRHMHMHPSIDVCIHTYCISTLINRLPKNSIRLLCAFKVIYFYIDINTITRLCTYTIFVCFVYSLLHIEKHRAAHTSCINIKYIIINRID